MSHVLVLSTSLHHNSNSEILAQKLTEGIKDAGNQVEYISLKDKKISFCVGCLACQTTQKCVIKDDAVAIAEKVKNADSIVFATPIYYYEMSGQMKTLLDRLNPLYPSDYKFRNIYMLAVAAEDANYVYNKAENGLIGWVDCFEKANFCETVFCGGMTEAGQASKMPEALEKVYEFGKKIK